jgi:hypothetical protein
MNVLDAGARIRITSVQALCKQTKSKWELSFSYEWDIIYEPALV